jgi:pimeloyl-ACP methyl ester carboxylesterase
MPAAIVYVHGLWLTGYEAWLLGHRVRAQCGFDWRTFHYASTAQSMAEISAALQAYVAGIDAPEVHLVGHSMGGIAILRMMAANPVFPPGRVVLLGTPAQPSRAARSLARHPLGRMMLGRAANEEMVSPQQRTWSSERELGLIVGTQELGLARLVVNFEEPNDGVVTVAETSIPGASARIVLPVGHTSMLFSARVASAVGSFLGTGQFDS